MTTHATIERATATFVDTLRLHTAFARRLARRLGIAEAEVDDLCQFAFIVMWRKQEQVREGSERAFLAAVMRRQASRLRVRVGLRAEVELGEADCFGQEPLADERLDQVRRRAQLLRLIEEQLGTNAQVLRLSLEQDMSCSEIARRLGIPVGTVKSRLARARREFMRVKEMLDGWA